MNKTILKFSKEIVLFVVPLFLDDFSQYRGLIHVYFCYFLGQADQSSGNLGVVDSIWEGCEFTRILLCFLFLLFAIFLIILLDLLPLSFFFIENHILKLILNFLLLFTVLLLKLLNFVNRIKFFQNSLSDISSCLAPKG